MANDKRDLDRYKEAARKTWEDTAEGWHRWSSLISDLFEDETRRMLEMARIEKGSRVLDIAAGDGATSVLAAEIVGPDGHVLATDISPGLVHYAAAAAEKAGFNHMHARVMDGENLELPDETVDAVICRLGLMLMPHHDRALREFHRVLRPGGRLSVIVISSPDRNPWLSIPGRIAMKHAGLPAPGPGAPGPFSLAAPGRLESAARAAGFRDVETHTAPGSMRLASAQECLQYLQDAGGGLHTILAPLDAEARQRAWAEIGQALKGFETEAGFVSPAESVLAAGSR